MTTKEYQLQTLCRYLRLIKSGKLAKAEKQSLLTDCNLLADSLNIRLGDYNSPEFGRRAFRRLSIQALRP